MGKTSETITDRINKAMADAGFDRPIDLANAVGVSKQTVGDWIKGRTINIRPEHLVKLADVLKVEIRWLATGEGPKRIATTYPAVREATEILSIMDKQEVDAYLTILRASKAA